MKRKCISIVRSETWMGDSFNDISYILDQTIKDHVENERIINIQIVEEGGLKRFWIYLEE